MRASTQPSTPHTVKPGITVVPAPVNGVIDGDIAPVGVAGVPIPMIPDPDAAVTFPRQASNVLGSCPPTGWHKAFERYDITVMSGYT